MDKFTLKLAAKVWAQKELAPMLKHMRESVQGGCSFEKWTTLAFGKYLIDHGFGEKYQYEKRYHENNPKEKCDLWVDDFWIEIKQIWKNTYIQDIDYLNNDIQRVKSVGPGTLLVFEFGQPDWYLEWKEDKGGDVIFVLL